MIVNNPNGNNLINLIPAAPKNLRKREKVGGSSYANLIKGLCLMMRTGSELKRLVVHIVGNRWAQIVEEMVCVEIEGIEKETMKLSAPSSRPDKTLEARIILDTLEQRQAESSSGLTMTKKELISVDLQPSPERNELGTANPNPLKPGNVFSVLQNSDERDNEFPLTKAKCHKIASVSFDTLPATVITNRFAVLQTIDEVVNEVTSVEGEEHVEDAYVENAPTQHESQSDTVIFDVLNEVLMLDDEAWICMVLRTGGDDDLGGGEWPKTCKIEPRVSPEGRLSDA
ncbi:OLC1v1036574C1 [Oldenlandia corymbosa var. corymbosa]|uniref:OLC1v1036574C1 n=1 Tax=Oldenlandia corymbosa var. corymbosa TaxID=529605 RepID=A0AAV1CYC0_OLDCO|nr:OLC1v1036574C1 [Oldenlandia corymbosa var. corymbosa]